MTPYDHTIKHLRPTFMTEPTKQELQETIAYLLDQANDARQAANQATRDFEAQKSAFNQLLLEQNRAANRIKADAEMNLEHLRSEVSRIRQQYQNDLKAARQGFAQRLAANADKAADPHKGSDANKA